MKNFVLLGVAFLAVVVILHAGLTGLMKDQSHGFFLIFIGGLTTIGLGLDVVKQLKIHIRKNSLRKLGR